MKRKALLLMLLLAFISSGAWAQSAYHSYTATGGTTGQSGQNYDKLVDNQTSTKWCVVQSNDNWSSTGYIEFESDDLIIPSQYVMTTGNDNATYHGRNPKSWVIKAKVNSSDSWTTIASVSNNTTMQDVNYEPYTFNFASTITTAYKYFRFEISAIQSGGVMQLSEFHFIATVQGGGSSDHVDIGTGTNTTGYAPVYGNYKSSYAQMIYTAEQLQAVGITSGGTISKIGFKSSATNQYSRKPIIYIGHTSKSSFSGNTDFVSINDLQEVYNYSNHSEWSITAGWNEFELDTPFEYDGTSNLVIAMHCGLISSFSSSYFYYTSTTNIQVIYARSDSTDPIPSNYEGNWSSYGTSYLGTSEYLPNLRLYYHENIEEISIGDDASTSSQYSLPVNMYYNNSMTQQIFTANEIGTAGTIKSISFNCTNIGSSSNAKTVKVYMKHTNKETFSSNTDVVRMDAADEVIASFTLLPTATGWVKMTLDTPFEYDGQSNLLICCYDHSNKYPGSSYKFQTTATTGYTSIAYYSDSNYDYNPTGTPTTDGIEAYYQYRNNLKMEIVPATIVCHKPSDLSLDAVSATSATISWTSDGSSFEYVYGTTGFTPDWSGTTYTTSSTSVQLTNLTHSTVYDFYVRTICGTDNYTTSSQLSFHTDCGAITAFPWSEDFEGYNSGDFSDPCWVNERIQDGTGSSGSLYIFQVNTSTTYGNETHQLKLPDMKAGTITQLRLPEMTLASGSDYQFVMNVYRDSNSKENEGVKVLVSANGEVEGATELGFIQHYYQYAPAESATGWYTYRFPIPFTGTCYIILLGYSQYGTATYMDNFTVKLVPNHPLKIVASNPASDEMTWDQFVSYVNNDGDDYFGKTVVLMDNITVNTMVGTADHPFSGTFDGNNKTLDVDISSDEQGAAPFRYISGATIKRLVVTGYVTATAHHASGLVGFCAAGSTNKIENCLVHTSVTNNNDYNGDNGNNFIGGLIGHNLTATTTIEGCVYNGTLTSQGFKGGMVGFGDYNSTVVIKDSYFNGSYSTNGYADPNFSPIACHGSGRNFNFTFSNFYYNTEAGTFTAPNYEGTVNASYSTTGRAKLAHTITAESPATVFMEGDVVDSYTVSGINAYATGIVYGALIAGEGDQVALTLSGSPTGVYETSCGTLNGSTLTMGDCNAVISAVTCPAPTGLAASNITGHTVDLNWTGYSDSYNVLYGALDAQGTVLETGFEDGQIPAAFTNDANHRWKVTSGGANNSSYCAIPGNKGVDSSDSDLAFVVIGPGTVSFRAKVSSESGYDYGRFLIDGAQEVNISGTQDWSSYSFELTAGSHTLVWRYHKDGSSYSGEDLFYVDDITVVGLMVGEWQTVTVDEANATLTDLNPETLYEAKVQGVCDGDEMSNPSETITFTTLEACPVPYNLSIPSSEITANSAFLTWVGGSDSYNVKYGALNTQGTVLETGFEDDGQIPAAFTNDANHRWKVTSGGANNSSYCAIPGNKGVDSSDSDLAFVVIGPGTVSFIAKVSSESGYDYGRFLIDGAQKVNISGTQDWTLYSFELTAGSHTLVWRYHKDSSSASGEDLFYVDDITVVGLMVGEWQTAQVTETSCTLEGLSPSTQYQVQVQGVCDNEPTAWSATSTFTTGSGYQVSVSVNDATMGSASITYSNETSTTEDGPVSVSVAPDTEVTVTAVPGDGFVFVNWTEPNSETGAYDVMVSDTVEYSFTPVGNRDLRANFAVAHHTLTIVAAYGTVTVDGDPYIEPIELEEGGEVYVKLSNWGDYQFTGWTVDGTGSEMEEPTLSGTTFIMGTTNTILTANFDFEEICFEAGEGTSYETSDHWFLFTSPLSVPVNPSDVYGLFYEGDSTSVFYDLYCFDQTEELEWRNWKESEENGGHFNLEAGKGYLYANGYADVELCFTGEPYNGNGNITITNIPDNNWAGWNLVGNPYNREMYSSMLYYAMNNDGDNGPELVSRTTDISLQPMEGFFVYCESGTGTVSLSTTAPNAKHTSLSLNISRGRGLVDRAIVSFSNGNTLPKFQLNPNHTKVYIPKDEKDYAVVDAESEMGEMPVNFKAERNGSYTISVTSEGVRFGYLHLIDNMTGNDIDLLATPSYTFDAMDTDYASRFKLVFATGSSTGSDAFAFYSNGNWIINNEGGATIQVIDVNGRIIRNETINGCANVNVNAAPGVYMLRLMNGENVKVQKVVVK